MGDGDFSCTAHLSGQQRHENQGEMGRQILSTVHKYHQGTVTQGIYIPGV